MKINITPNEMADILLKLDPDKFTREGAWILCSFLDEQEDENAVFCPGDIRCNFSEYATLIEWAEQYFNDYKKEFSIRSEDSIEDIERLLLDWLSKRTLAIKFDNGLIVREF